MTDKEKQKLDIFQNLLDAGCDIDVIEQFFQLQISGTREDQFSLLYHQRRLILETVHKHQKCLDCLDHLLFRMKKESQPTKRRTR